ncbi:hypothetical protein JG687_00014013 [Phytophthora cactorum]|uniref:SET domain-containing protein n=1 Tax=Phytophthora cactorum TaxID=29920 RepID=A0A8T1U100_9STRA|nr:hypothetical protein JG687_00014013 [Phytophthora cactorum]
MHLEREIKDINRNGIAIHSPVTSTEVIDARHFGKMARFANHSCSSNCTSNV